MIVVWEIALPEMAQSRKDRPCATPIGTYQVKSSLNNDLVTLNSSWFYLEPHSLVNWRELLDKKSFLQRKCVDGREAGTSVTLLTLSVLVINTDVLQLPNMSLEMVPYCVAQRFMRVWLNGVIWREGAELRSAVKDGDVGPHRVLRPEGQGDGGRGRVGHLGGHGGPAVTVPLLGVAWKMCLWIDYSLIKS